MHRSRHVAEIMSLSNVRDGDSQSRNQDSSIDDRSPRLPEELRRTALLQCVVRVVGSTFRTIAEYPTAATMLRPTTVQILLSVVVSRLGSAQLLYKW